MSWLDAYKNKTNGEQSELTDNNDADTTEEAKVTSSWDLFTQELENSHYKKPLKAENIEKTPFYKNTLNLVYGLSKSGKSYSIAEMLSKTDIPRNQCMWLDADYNVNSGLVAMLNSFFLHINNNVQSCCKKLLKQDGSNVVLIFDSLKDFSNGNDIDSNAGSQKVMEYFREFTKKGYTLIVLAHATNGEDGFKLKGNAETIVSKSDIVYKLSAFDDFRELKVTHSRISDVEAGDSFTIYDIKKLKKKIDDIIDETEEITLRDITNKLPSSLRDVFKEHQDSLVKIVLIGQKKVVKKV